MTTVPIASPAIQLHGFNNLSKSLSFNGYLLRHAASPRLVQKTLAELNARCNANALNGLLTDLSAAIGAHVLSMSRQDYQPHGASATLMLAEEELEIVSPELTLAHLDKSHVSAHTYPEYHPHNGMLTLRLDVELSTCGDISPTTAIGMLFDWLAPDVVTMDYRVRGFTRDNQGSLLYQDHELESLQSYLPDEMRGCHHLADINRPRERSLHTRAWRKRLDSDRHVVGRRRSAAQRRHALDLVAAEIGAIR